MRRSASALLTLLLATAVPHSAIAAAPQVFPGTGERMHVDFEEDSFDLDFHRDGSTLTFQGTRGPAKGLRDTVTYRYREIAPGVHRLTWQRVDPITRAPFTSVVHIQNWNTRRVFGSFTNEALEFTQREGPLRFDPY